MRASSRPIRIATRKSHLAMVQSQAVAHALQRLNPSVEVRLQPMDTRGDQMLSHPLAAIGGKGLFTSALEGALLADRADIAVHSLKDMPANNRPGLIIAAVPTRADVRDCLIAHTATSVAALPHGAIIGTSSQRRAAQLARVRPDLRFEPLRGNIETRIKRIHEEHRYDATLLAVAGLERAGLGEHTALRLDVEMMLPSAGQAALAIQCRAGDHVTLRRCLPLNDSLTATCVEAERAVVAALGADCTSPIAVLAQPTSDNRIRLRARVLSHDGTRCIDADATDTLQHLRHATAHVVNQLFTQGAKQLL